MYKDFDKRNYKEYTVTPNIPTEANKNYTWDYIEHIPVPTLDFIRSRTGLNNAGENTPKMGKILALKASSIIKGIFNDTLAISNDRDVQEAFLAEDIEKQMAFVLATIALLDSQDVTGIINAYFDHGLDVGITREDMDKAVRIKPVMTKLKAANFFQGQWNIQLTNKRVGY